MPDIDFDRIEDELDLVVPNIYRMFVDAVNSKGYDLKRYGFYHNTKAVLKGNRQLRLNLSEIDPKWENGYFDFGVGDGCGNYFFLRATDEDDDLVQLWSHDPPGIEDVSSATGFFTCLLAELDVGFNGPNRYRFQGNGSWN